jgi:hypothetical protein
MLTAFVALGVFACAIAPVSETEEPLREDPVDNPGFGTLTADVVDDGDSESDFEFPEEVSRLSGLAPVEEEPEPLADSVAEFSSVQGRDSWWYGYFQPDSDADFHQAGTYIEGGADPGWYAGAGGQTWTFLDAETMHPNGETTTEGREPVEQWAVRRWVSEVDGDIEITGHLAKYWVDGTSSGIAGYIYVDGAMVWAWYLEGWDNAGIDFDKVVAVHAGSTVDFALDPWESDDRSDRSVFTATIYAVEE